MRDVLDWLVEHEKSIVIIVLFLTIALVVQLKFCGRHEEEPDITLTQSQTPQSQLESGSEINVAGKWEMDVKKKSGVSSGQIWVLNLRQNGKQLKGVLTSEGGDLPVSGTIDGQNIELSAKRFGVTIKFPATIREDVMTGEMEALTVKRQWTAKRKE